jgi:hypothetical protein
LEDWHHPRMRARESLNKKDFVKDAVASMQQEVTK